MSPAPKNPDEPLSHWSGAQDQTPDKKKKPNVNFRQPQREYQTVKKGRWSFEVEKQLMDEAPAVANNALKRLQENLDEALRSLPKPAQPILQELKQKGVRSI